MRSSSYVRSRVRRRRSRALCPNLRRHRRHQLAGTHFGRRRTPATDFCLQGRRGITDLDDAKATMGRDPRRASGGMQRAMVQTRSGFSALDRLGGWAPGPRSASPLERAYQSSRTFLEPRDGLPLRRRSMRAGERSPCRRTRSSHSLFESFILDRARCSPVLPVVGSCSSRPSGCGHLHRIPVLQIEVLRRPPVA